MRSFIYFSCLFFKNGSFLVFSGDGSKNSVTIGAKCLIASETSSLALLETVMDYWVVRYH